MMDTSTKNPPAQPHPYQKSLEVLLSYPQFIPHEESLYTTPYDVPGWIFYMDQIDSLMESMQTHLDSNTQKAPSAQKDFCIPSEDDLEENDTLSLRELPPSMIILQKARIMVGERSLSLLPGSYKLWKHHLEYLMQYSSYPKTISGFERSLVRLNKMPRIWILYVNYVREMDVAMDVTFLRRLHDRALLALPVTQHDLIWTFYRDWITSGIPRPLPKLHSTSEPTSNSTQNLSPLLKEYPHRRLYENGTIPTETIIRVLQRYILYDPTQQEYWIQIGIALHQYGTASQALMTILNSPQDYQSPTGITLPDIWNLFSDLCTKHPEETRRVGMDFDVIVRSMLDSKLTKNEWGEIHGSLWCKLADYHIRNGEFELARSVYEEGLERVMTVRDFGRIFDAFANFEEGSIAAMMELMPDEDDIVDHTNDTTTSTTKTTTPTNNNTTKKEDGYDSDLDILLARETTTTSNNTDSPQNAAMDLALARAEYLMERRPLLLNRVLLRQNPHNVGEWIRRADLYIEQSHPTLAVEALEEASTKIHAKRAVNGNPADVFIKWGLLVEESYSNTNDTEDAKEEALEQARHVFQQVCHKHSFSFKNIDDLAQVYSAYIELELRHDCFDNALSLTRQAISDPSPGTTGVARFLHKSSLRLWNLALDLEESLSNSISATRDAYERCIHVKVATPTILLNYAAFLKAHDYFEDGFAAYEKGLELFPPPHASSIPLWKTYLQDFVERYKGTKIVRTRELFERCLAAPHPPEEASLFYLLYANFEQEHASGPSLTKRLLHIYERQCTALPLDQKLQAYQLYIAKTTSLLGATATRPIYETAIQACNDTDASIICHEFAQLEVQLNEIARARAAYTYGSQLVDPRRDQKGYWSHWSDFEISHGDEESFREMLRVKRAVTAAFSTVNYNAAEMGASVNGGDGQGGEQVLKEEEAMEMLQRSEGLEPQMKSNISGFVSGGSNSGTKRSLTEANVGLEEVEKRAERLRRKVGEQENANIHTGEGDEIDIEDDDDIDIDIDEDEDDQVKEQPKDKAVSDVQTKSVPALVFGGLASAASKMPSENKPEEKKMGALERLRKAAAANSSGTTG